MVEIKDIVDRESLEGWLRDQPKEVSVWIARRAAMRLLPYYLVWAVAPKIESKANSATLSFLRFYLISEVERKMPTFEVTAESAAASYAVSRAAIAAAELAAIESAAPASSAIVAAAEAAATHAAAKASASLAARAAADAARAAADASDEAVARAVVAATEAATESAAHAAAADAAAGRAAAATHAAITDSAAVWETIRVDREATSSGVDLDQTPLWADQKNPIGDVWEGLKAKLSVANPSHSPGTAHDRAPVDWSFWIKWYDSVLAGESLNGDMLEEIALIDPVEWEKGAARVNALIGEIEQKYAREAAPYPETLTYDGEYHVVPVSELPARSLKDARDRIADVSRDMRKGGNQYSALGDEADVLDDVLARYPDRAIRLFEVCHKVVGHVVRHIENGVLPEGDNLIGDVLADLQNSADDIYNFDVEVRASVDARAKLRFDRLDQGQRDTVVALAEAVAQNSDADLAEEMRLDAAEVMAADDPEGESKPARYRLGSRLVKVLLLGGAGVGTILGSLAAVEPAVSGAQYLWLIVRPLIGF